MVSGNCFYLVFCCLYFYIYITPKDILSCMALHLAIEPLVSCVTGKLDIEIYMFVFDLCICRTIFVFASGFLISL